jgi:hypothetical protein
MGLFANNALSDFMKNQQDRLNETQIWLTIVNNEEVKEFIISLNTEDQLFEKGIDSDGVSLKDIGGNDFTDSGYSPVTIEIKKTKTGKGSKTTNITLYDTGEYYESHEVNVDARGFTITADPQKDDTNLFDEWGENIVGLTDESLQKLISFLLIKYVNYTRDVIFKS